MIDKRRAAGTDRKVAGRTRRLLAIVCNAVQAVAIRGPAKAGHYYGFHGKVRLARSG